MKIKSQGFIKSIEIQKRFNVTRDTANRDLNYLIKLNLIKREGKEKRLDVYKNNLRQICVRLFKNDKKVNYLQSRFCEKAYPAKAEVKFRLIMNEPLVSVILTAQNKETNIADCLQLIESQGLSPRPFVHKS